MAQTANRGFVALVKRGWDEMPEVLGSGAFGLLGLGLSIAANIRYYKNDGDNRLYRAHYTVYRHDDPRVAKLKTQCDLTSQE